MLPEYTLHRVTYAPVKLDTSNGLGEVSFEENTLFELDLWVKV